MSCSSLCEKLSATPLRQDMQQSLVAPCWQRGVVTPDEDVTPPVLVSGCDDAALAAVSSFTEHSALVARLL